MKRFLCLMAANVIPMLIFWSFTMPQHWALSMTSLFTWNLFCVVEFYPWICRRLGWERP